MARGRRDFHAKGMGDFELLARWEEWLRAQGYSEHTIRLYAVGVVKLHRQFVQGSPAEATEAHVAAFLASLGNRAVTRAHYHRGCRSFFRYCLARGLITHDPTELVKPLRPPQLPPVALTEDELMRYFLAAAWRSPRRAWTLMALFGIGARRMELEAVRPDDIEGDVVHLRQCKYGKERRVELSTYGRIALEELRPWWNGTVLGGIDRQTITAWAHQAAVDSGLLPKVRGRVAHVLRASFATHLLSAGAPVQVVRDLMGHQNIATTDRYSATMHGQRQAAIERLDFGARHVT